MASLAFENDRKADRLLGLAARFRDMKEPEVAKALYRQAEALRLAARTPDAHYSKPTARELAMAGRSGGADGG